jgi:uncharacterized protein with NAD-binding domain and iron-sulfur cluster
MKVAIIGGNLLGCATAFYTREALRLNAADAGTEAADDIVIFEATERLGGHKFARRDIPSVPGSATPVGTCAELDVAACPLL